MTTNPNPHPASSEHERGPPEHDDGVLFSIHQPMVSGRGDAEAKTYKLLHGKSGLRWLIAVLSNEGDYIYVEGGPGSDGFGGATLHFQLENGECISLKGPWKTGPAGLYEDTGYDCRDKCLSFGIVALEKQYGHWLKGDLYTQVLFKDVEWTIGNSKRIERIADEFTKQLGRKVFYAFVSPGGGCSGVTDPSKERKAS